MPVTEKKKYKRSASSTSGPHRRKLLPVRPPDYVREAIETLAKNEQWTVAYTVSKLIHEALRKRRLLTADADVVH